MKINKTTAGFTLVEMLLSISLIAVLGLVVYSCLSGGLRIWQRVNTPSIGEDVNIFFEKLSVDMYNSFPYKDIEFIGNAEGFQCASIVTTDSANPGLAHGVGEVSYFYDKENQAIIRRKKNLSDIFREKNGAEQKMIGNITAGLFQYYYYDPRAKEYFWVEEWKKGSGIPIALASKIDINYGGKDYKFSKFIIIPVH